MAVAVAQDDKGKGRLNESTLIKQEFEDSDCDAQVRLQLISGLSAASCSFSAQAFLLSTCEMKLWLQVKPEDGMANELGSPRNRTNAKLMNECNDSD